MTTLPLRRRLAPRLRNSASRLRRSESGLALVEFAVSLPVLLTLGLVGLETAHYAMAHLKVSNMASMAADNAARIRDSIDEADVNELLMGTLMTGDAIDFDANGRIILSSLEASPDGTRQWIRWQRCDGNLTQGSSFGRPLTAAGAAIGDGTERFNSTRYVASANPSSHVASTMTAMGSTGNQIAAQPGTAVMVVEVVYRYQPLVANDALGGSIIRYLTAFNVRQRTNQSLNNAGRITPASCG